MAHLQRLRASGRLAAMSLSVAIAGCAIHPLPEDVSGATTFDIVERIRCEAQEGLRSFEDDDAWRIAGATTIGMSFTLDMTATADAGISMDFDKVASKRHFALDTDAGFTTLQRKNTRAFQVIDTLIEIHDYDCDGKVGRRNLAHPITGRIGLSEVVRTYLQLEKQTNLLKVSDTVFSDTLDFTTTYDAGFGATWQKDAVAGRITLTRVALSAGATRRDAHTLHVTLTRNPVGPAGSGLAQKAQLRALIESENIRDPRTQVALVQKESGAKTRTILELERLRVLNDDDRVAARVIGQRMLDVLKVP